MVEFIEKMSSHFNTYIFLGVLAEMIFNKTYLDFKGITCYFTKEPKKFQCALDLLIAAIFYSYLGGILLLDTDIASARVALICGFSMRITIREILNKKGLKEEEKNGQRVLQ